MGDVYKRQQLYSYTQLQDSFGVIMLALENGVPKVMTLKEMLEQYLKFQFEVVTRRTAYDPVSYTHLDVYKRQSRRRAAPPWW